MAAKSKVNTEWAVRLLIIAVAALVFGAWFVYDGAVAWPELNRKGELAYDKSVDADGNVRWIDRPDWQERLTEHGYEADKMPPTPRPQQDITMQFVWAGVCFPVGLLLLVNLYMNASRKLYTDDRALHYGKKSLAFSDIQRIDYDRWDSKGIAIVHGSGNTSIKIDDWKYKGGADVLADVERQVPGVAREAAGSGQAEQAEPTTSPAPAQSSDSAGS